MIEQSTREVLREHAARYPKMQPQDAVKLLYQANFGPGHLVSDVEKATARIEDEQQTVSQIITHTVENIGHGFVRVYLTHSTSSKDLARIFVLSAGSPRGSQDDFEADIAVLRDVTANGCFGFNITELDDYLTGYRTAGMPMASHSSEYKEAYNPAYRVVLACLAKDIFTNK